MNGVHKYYDSVFSFLLAACNTSDLIGSSEPSNQTCYIDGEIGHMLELNNVEVCYNGTTPGSVARYNCSAGYVLSAGAISPRTCRDDGQWDGSSVISCGE